MGRAESHLCGDYFVWWTHKCLQGWLSCTIKSNARLLLFRRMRVTMTCKVSNIFLSLAAVRHKNATKKMTKRVYDIWIKISLHQQAAQYNNNNALLTVYCSLSNFACVDECLVPCLRVDSSPSSISLFPAGPGIKTFNLLEEIRTYFMPSHVLYACIQNEQS